MANPAMKKVEIQLPSEVYKTAKLQATQDGKSLPEWIATLVEAATQTTESSAAEPQTAESQTISPLDWGRIDSRIDQRIAMVERHVEKLAEQVAKLSTKQLSSEQLSTERVSTEQTVQSPLSDRSVLSSSSLR